MGIGELLLIFIVSLIVFGPDKTLSFTHQIAETTKKARRFWDTCTNSPQDKSPHEH